MLTYEPKLAMAEILGRRARTRGNGLPGVPGLAELGFQIGGPAYGTA
jgi:hypothetical protein